MSQTSSQTLSDIYTPTVAERRLLDALLSPENRFLNVLRLCKKAGVSRPTYYLAFSKPGFVALYKEMSIRLAERVIGPVMATFADEAVRGSFQHGKVILEMAGVYSEKQVHEHTGKDGGPIEVSLEDMTDEQLLERAEQLKERLAHLTHQ